MSARRFQLDELTIRPGTYFNPQTEVLIVVDDSPEVDHEIFNMDDFESTDWVLIADDTPLDERRRDELVEHFELTYPPGGGLSGGGREDDLDEDDHDELDVDELEGDELEPDELEADELGADLD
jgi:hypothetical protein